MIRRLTKDREDVKVIIKEEVEKLMRMGTEITDMTYFCNSSNLRRPCVTPRNMRTSYCQDGSASNLKRIHWIFYKLPCSTYQDILMNRQTHGNLVVAKVMRRMNIIWGPKKEGETVAHTNCIMHMYSRMLCEKKQTVIKRDEGNVHNRIPFVRNPKKLKGKTVYYWSNKEEGTHQVSCK